MLSDGTMTVSQFDQFGNVLTSNVATVGVDLTLQVVRTFTNDTNAWVLGQLQTQSVCSTASMISQCRLLTRHTTAYGEVHDEATSSDDGLPDTQLSTTYGRDAYGNVTTITASDAFGHQRVSTTTYDAEGIFPIQRREPGHADHARAVRPSVRQGRHADGPEPARDELGVRRLRGLGIETRPDRTQTTVTLARAKNGGPAQNAWQVTQRSTTTGGADDTVAYDSLGRPIQWWWYGPQPSAVGRVTQEIAYDALGEHVAQRSVPVSEGTPESKMLFDTYQYDAMGREVLHTTPWSAATQTAYSGLQVQVTDPLMNVTTTEQDALGRAVSVTDATMAVTAYAYGPFGSSVHGHGLGRRAHADDARRVRPREAARRSRSGHDHLDARRLRRADVFHGCARAHDHVHLRCAGAYPDARRSGQRPEPHHHLDLGHGGARHRQARAAREPRWEEVLYLHPARAAQHHRARRERGERHASGDARLRPLPAASPRSPTPRPPARRRSP